MKSHRAAFIALLTTACGGQGGFAPLYVAIEPVASIEAPVSESSALVLLEDGIACVTETYWYRIVCKDPGGESLMFGARGEGPGEFLFPHRVLRAPEGMIGVMDPDLGRLSLFTERGGFVKAVSSFPGFPTVFSAAQMKVVGETMAGTTRDPTQIRRNLEIELATGHVLWERSFPLERARPIQWYGARVVDDRQRFWAVSHSPSPYSELIPRTSHIDLFYLTADGPQYGFTLEVRDDVLGMDVLGDTLAVLVQRDIGSVLPERRVDWYDVATLDQR